MEKEIYKTRFVRDEIVYLLVVNSYADNSSISITIHQCKVEHINIIKDEVVYDLVENTGDEYKLISTRVLFDSLHAAKQAAIEETKGILENLTKESYVHEDDDDWEG